MCRIFVVSNVYKKKKKLFLKDALWGGGGTHRSWPGGRGGRPGALIPGEGRVGLASQPCPAKPKLFETPRNSLKLFETPRDQPLETEEFRGISRNLKESRGVFEEFRRVSKSFEEFRGVFEESRGVSRSFEEFRGVSRSRGVFEEFRGVSRSLEEFRGVSRSFEDFREVSRGFRGVSRNLEEFPGVSRIFEESYGGEFQEVSKSFEESLFKQGAYVMISRIQRELFAAFSS